MDPIEAHVDSAPEYDRQALDWGWNPGVFLGMLWEHVAPGQRLLDIGIGTGLSSAPFHRIGLAVHGFDGSQQMLDICAFKRFAADLRRHDIAQEPWPYEEASFDCAICAGVFHLFGELGPTFAETARVLRPGAVFGFTCSRGESAMSDGYARQRDEASGVLIYVHGDAYVARALDDAGFDPQGKLVFLASTHPETGAEHYCTLLVARMR